MRNNLFDRLKRWGELAAAMTAVAAVFSAMVAAFGGHLPPWATWAWAMSLEDATKQNSIQIGQLNTLLLSDKVSQLEGAVAANPGDQNLRASLNYWKLQLQIAQSASLPMAQRSRPSH